MKLLIDRLRPYAANKKLKGKIALIIIPAAEGPSACMPIVEMFRMSFKFLGMKFVGKVLATANERGEIKNDKKKKKEAFKLGVSL